MTRPLLSLRPEFAADDALFQQQGVAGRGDPAGGQTPAGTEATEGGGQAAPGLNDACMDQLPILIGMVLIFYLILIRPQQKQEKQRKAMIEALKKGDKVVTNGGLHGVVASLDNQTVTIRVDKDMKLVFDRAAVGRVHRDEPAADAAS